MIDRLTTGRGSKGRVILVTREDLFIDVISVFLEGWFDAEVEIADSSRKLEQLFAGGTPVGVSLVLVEEEKLLHAAGKSIADFGVPAIVIGKAPELPPVTGRRLLYVDRPVDVDKLSAAVECLATASGVARPEYCAVRLSTLVLFRRDLTHDLYRKEADGTFVKALGPGQSVAACDLGAMDFVNGGSLWVKAGDFGAFLSAFAADLQSICSVKVFELADSVAVATSVHEMVAQGIPELGFTPELQAAVKASIDSALDTIRREPKLAELLRELEKNDAEYLSWHSVGLCYIACRLSSLMTWDSPNTHFKLSLAAFLHDLTLRNPKFQKMKTLQELRLAGANPEEIAEFHDHPFAAAAIAREMRGFPGDVDHIIAEHHELPNGKGFPMGINHTRISPLAAVFIIGHELIDELYNFRAGFDLKEMITRLEKTHGQGYFRRVLSALKEASNKEGVAL